MDFEQVKFRTLDGEPGRRDGGIAVYRYGNHLGVICGCCGAWNSAKRVQILEHYENWLDFGTALIEVHDSVWPDDEEEE